MMLTTILITTATTTMKTRERRRNCDQVVRPMSVLILWMVLQVSSPSPSSLPTGAAAAAATASTTASSTSSSSSSANIFDDGQGRQYLPRPRIVGGVDTSERRYPYFVSLLNGRGEHACGGSLIAPDIVISAAHCVPSIRYAQVGRYRRHSSTDSGSGGGTATTAQQSYDNIDDDYEEFDLTFDSQSDSTNNNNNNNNNISDDVFIVHPLYEQETNFQNDVVLIHLKQQSTHPYVKINTDPDRPYSDQYPSMQQDDNSNNQQQLLTVLGLGYTLYDDPNSAPDVLQEASLRYVPNDICEQSNDPAAYDASSPSSSGSSSASASYYGLITPDMLCASDDPVQKQDACQGDSGGPLLLLSSSELSTSESAATATSSTTSSSSTSIIDEDVLVGIVCWGFGCSNPNFPGVYARVSFHSNWIRHVVCTRSIRPPSYLMCQDIMNNDSSSSSSNNDGESTQQRPSGPSHPMSTPVTLFVNFNGTPQGIGWSIGRRETSTVLVNVEPGTYSDLVQSTTTTTTTATAEATRNSIIETVYLPPSTAHYVLTVKKIEGEVDVRDYRLVLGRPLGGDSVSTDSDDNGIILVSGDGAFVSSREHDFQIPTDFLNEWENPIVDSDATNGLEDGKVPLTVVVMLGSNPQEVGWSIDLLGTEETEVISVVPGVYKTPRTKIVRTVPLDRNELYFFRIYGTGNNRIEVEYVQLYLATTNIFDDTKLIFESDGTVEREIGHTFLATMDSDGTPLISEYTNESSYLSLELITDLFPGDISYQIRMIRGSEDDISSTVDDQLIFFRPPRYFENFVNARVVDKIPLPDIPSIERRQFFFLIQDRACCIWSGDRRSGYTLYYGEPNEGKILVTSAFEKTEKEIQGFKVPGTYIGANILPPEVAAGIELKVSITLDDHPDETGFYIEDMLRRRVVDVKPGTFAQKNELVEETVTLEPGQYTFAILDVFGDGLTRSDARYTVELVDPDNVGRPPLVSGNGAFTSRESHPFLVEGDTARLPLNILLDDDGDAAHDFGFTIHRLDLIESDALIATCPRGSCQPYGETFSYSLMVTEGGLYRIIFEKSGNPTDDIRVVLGFDSATGYSAIEYTASRSNFDSNRKLQMKVLASPQVTDVPFPPENSNDNNVLSLQLRFDRFPNEVEWVLLHDYRDNDPSIPLSGHSVVAYGPLDDFGPELAGQEYVKTIVVKRQENEEQYVLVITDSGMDGLCCNYGEGSVELYEGATGNKKLVFSNPFLNKGRLIATVTISGGPAKGLGCQKATFWTCATLLTIGAVLVAL